MKALYSTKSTLRQIISNNQNAENLLKSIGLNTSKNQDKTLLQICSELQWNEEELLKWIRSKSSTKKRPPAAEPARIGLPGKEISKLIQRLISLHHDLLMLREELSADYERVYKVHGHQFPALKDIHWHLNLITDKIRYYVMMVEKSLFTLAEASKNSNWSILDGELKQFSYAKKILSDDRALMEKSIRKINQLNQNIDQTEGNCSTLRITFQKMNRFFDIIAKLFEITHRGLIPQLNLKVGQAE